jgi:hypothetical protein
VGYEDALHRVKEDRNFLHAIKERKANLIGHILRSNCLLTRIVEGKIGCIEVTRRRGKRRRQLLNHLKELAEYWKLKEEAPDPTLWRILFERGYGLIVKTDQSMN